MWTMILADDEPLILHGLQKLVDWEQMGIRVIATSTDGNSALALILEKQPDLAILDISMPGKTGIEILEGIRRAHSATQVIFLSGFQQFDYALSAMRLGAVNYLLKPVDKEQLIESVKNCLPIGDMPEPLPAREELPPVEPSEAELVDYFPAAYTVLCPAGASTVERRLMRFTADTCVNSWLAEQNSGAAIYNTEPPVGILFKNQSPVSVRAGMTELAVRIEAQTHNRIGVMLGAQTRNITEMETVFAKVREALGIFYFDGYLKSNILTRGEYPFKLEADLASLKGAAARLIDEALNPDSTNLRNVFDELCALTAAASGGDAQTAMFQLLSIYEGWSRRIEALGIPAATADSNAMVTKASACHSFASLADLIWHAMQGDLERARSTVSGNEKKEALRAAAYIDEHYAENLTLDVMANYVHMNASYFSAYFKRQIGKNFKEYLNGVRLQHALQLLISTDKKSYEIADEAGFSDVKSFSDLFQKNYGKTPVAYRKELSNHRGQKAE